MLDHKAVFIFFHSPSTLNRHSWPLHFNLLWGRYAQSKNNNITGLFRTVVDEFNEDTFRWVFNSVNSRCFHLNEMDLCSASELALSNRLFGRLSKKKVERITSYKDFERHLDNEEEYNNNLCCLIPYVDMLNHSLKPNGTELILKK